MNETEYSTYCAACWRHNAKTDWRVTTTCPQCGSVTTVVLSEKFKKQEQKKSSISTGRTSRQFAPQEPQARPANT